MRASGEFKLETAFTAEDVEDAEKGGAGGRARRRWFQFHLSTLLIGSLLSGYVVYLNLCPRRPLDDRPSGIITVGNLFIGGDRYEQFERGFPFTMNYAAEGEEFSFQVSEKPFDGHWALLRGFPKPPRGFEGQWLAGAMVKNLFVGLCAIAITMIVAEALMRRRRVKGAQGTSAA